RLEFEMHAGRHGERRHGRISCRGTKPSRELLAIWMLGSAFSALCRAWAFAGSSSSCKRLFRSTLRIADPRMAMPARAMVDVGVEAPQFSAAQAILVFLCAAIPLAYWWLVIVPFKRRDLASSKRKGELKEYLTTLAEAPLEERGAEKWFYDKYLRQSKLAEPGPTGLTKAVESLEDGLQQALPGGGFWSFDNPIFVGLVTLGIFCTQQILAHELGL
ncbi:unnamed protein product, partial [Effrenium voratum]